MKRQLRSLTLLSIMVLSSICFAVSTFAAAPGCTTYYWYEPRYAMGLGFYWVYFEKTVC